jgi:toluene monooxygenase system protein D
MSQFDELLKNNQVGPVMRAGEVAEAVKEAAVMDNPGKHVLIDDMNAYIRISTESELILTQASLEECLGRPFKMQELEVNLSSFAGQIETRSDQFRFFFNRSL